MAVEWRSGLAGHLILSDEDVTSVVQGTWKRLNTLQHYKVRTQPIVALSLLSSSTHCYALFVPLASGGSLSKGQSFLAAAYSNSVSAVAYTLTSRSIAPSLICT